MRCMQENILVLLTPKASVKCLEASLTIRQGLEKFRAHGYSAVPVINNDGTYVGVLNEGDFLWEIINNDAIKLNELENKHIIDIINKKVPSAKTDVNIEELIDLISNYNFVPIVDDRNVFMGIITRKAVINYLYSKMIEK